MTSTTARRVGLPGLLRAELVKLRGHRSVWVLAAAALLLWAGAGALNGWVVADNLRHGQDATEQVRTAASGGTMLVGPLLGIACVLLVTSETSSGSLAYGVLAAGRRAPVVLAKTVVGLGLTLGVGLLGAVLAMLAHNATAGSQGRVDLLGRYALRDAGATLVALLATSAIALGVAVLLRSAAGSVGVLLGLLIGLPLVTFTMAQGVSAASALTAWTPSMLMATVQSPPGATTVSDGPPAAMAVLGLLGWSAAAVLGGLARFTRGDLRLGS